MGRNIRTRLLTLKSQLYPRWPDLVKVAERDAEAKLKSAQNYNLQHGARSLKPLHPGSAVLVQNSQKNTWETIPTDIQSRVGDRSYLVRNRRHIKPFVDDSPILPSQEVSEGRTPEIDLSVEEKMKPKMVLPGAEVGDWKITINPEVKTRSGRVVRKVERLDL